MPVRVFQCISGYCVILSRICVCIVLSFGFVILLSWFLSMGRTSQNDFNHQTNSSGILKLLSRFHFIAAQLIGVDRRDIPYQSESQASPSSMCLLCSWLHPAVKCNYVSVITSWFKRKLENLRTRQSCLAVRVSA